MILHNPQAGALIKLFTKHVLRPHPSTAMQQLIPQDVWFNSTNSYRVSYPASSARLLLPSFELPNTPENPKQPAAPASHGKRSVLEASPGARSAFHAGAFVVRQEMQIA